MKASQYANQEKKSASRSASNASFSSQSIAQRVAQEQADASQVSQLAEEEELMQGKFDTAQLMEEEEMVQGKFKTTQLMEEEEPMQGKFQAAQLAGMEEEEPVQGKFDTVQAKPEKAPNNTGMPDNLKSGIESLSGYNMDDVKVHYNSSRPAQLNAHAYAQGSDIHVASGQEKHLAHEAWHVVQQKQGRVQPTTSVDGKPVNDNPGLEKEADVMGGKALSLKRK